MVTDNHCYK